ncbi:hypothetical protein ACHAAC_01655 [Aeromicrobium sp. CF4.19]|uniref:hypothetical protein n=1 Tax=Aeromicrobium sp. CF4.19 TaxID=3373082 RepID=UPI003EE67D1A
MTTTTLFRTSDAPSPAPVRTAPLPPLRDHVERGPEVTFAHRLVAALRTSRPGVGD